MDERHAETINRTAFGLAVFTVAYNLAEGVVSIVFAALDDSSALLGFGAGSFVESLSGAVMVWRFWDLEGAEQREQRAAKLVGVSLLVLAAYVTYEAVSTFLSAEEPDPSLAALIIAGMSLVVTPVLFLLKRRIANRIGS